MRTPAGAIGLVASTIFPHAEAALRQRARRSSAHRKSVSVITLGCNNRPRWSNTGSFFDQRGSAFARTVQLSPNSVADGADIGAFELQTEPVVPPSVLSIVRGSPNPTTPGSSVTFTVAFSASVTGVDSSDFALTTTGVSGASISSVAGSGSSYTVGVGVGSGSGTVRLDLIDDDSIVNGNAVPLGGAGAGNGNFTTGEVYKVAAAVDLIYRNEFE